MTEIPHDLYVLATLRLEGQGEINHGQLYAVDLAGHARFCPSTGLLLLLLLFLLCCRLFCCRLQLTSMIRCFCITIITAGLVSVHSTTLCVCLHFSSCMVLILVLTTIITFAIIALYRHGYLCSSCCCYFVLA